MTLTLPGAARVVLLLLSLCAAALLLMPNVRAYQAHRLSREAEAQQLWGRLEAAQASLRQALGLTPLDADLYRQVAELESRRAHWRAYAAAREQALAAYATATALNPLDGKLFAAYAEALLQAERFEAAHAALAEALRRDPNNANFHTLRGRLAEAEGDFETALGAYRRAEAIKPNPERQAHLEELLARGN